MSVTAARLAALIEQAIAVEAHQITANYRRALRSDLRAEYGRPTSLELTVAIYAALRAACEKPYPGSYVGAAQIVRQVAVDLGVPGANQLPHLRRTRAQVERAPHPSRRTGQNVTLDPMTI